jgi:hypothetical protein
MMAKKQDDAEWTEEEARKFRDGLKKMGFKPLARDCEDFCQGTETWSWSLGPVTGRQLRAAARKKRPKGRSAR